MDFFEQRGASENFAKELKNDFNGGRISHKDFVKKRNGIFNQLYQLQYISCVSK